VTNGSVRSVAESEHWRTLAKGTGRYRFVTTTCDVRFHRKSAEPARAYEATGRFETG